MTEQLDPLVLLIENREPLVRLMTWFLGEAGFKILVAQSTSEATRLITEHAPGVVVFNTELSPEARAELVAAWREETPALRVLHIELTHAPAPDVSSDLDAVVRIPFDADTITDTVRQLATLREGPGANAAG